MSADNEIAVVEFTDGWRVSEIRGCPDISERHLVVSQVDMTQTPMSYQDASNLAEKMFDEIAIVEYGITLWELPKSPLTEPKKP